MKDNEKVTIIDKHWKHIYNDWIKKAVESFPDRKIECKRSPEAPGNFVKGVVQDLNESDLVIAELTGNRPNVFYELGIRNALATGTIMITQDSSALPSDLHTYYCLPYVYTDKSHEYSDAFSRFQIALHTKIQVIIASGFPPDNPVADFLEFGRTARKTRFETHRRTLAALLKGFSQMLLEYKDALRSYLDSDGKMYQPNALYDLSNPMLIRALHTRLNSEFDFALFSMDLFRAIQKRADEVLRTVDEVLREVNDLGLTFNQQNGNWREVVLDKITVVEATHRNVSTLIEQVQKAPQVSI